MKQVLDLYKRINNEGRVNANRTKHSAKRIFGHQMRFNLAEGFPLVTTKKVHMKSIIVELLWFLQGRTDAVWLQENGCRIWNEWAIDDEDLDQPSTKIIHEQDRFELYLNTIEDDAARNAEKDRFNTGRGVGSAEAKILFDAAGIPEFYTYRELGHKVGDLGPVYGKQWRSWTTPTGEVIDQITETISLLKTKQFSRRIIVSAWNPADLPDESISPQANVLNGKMALAACHTLFQFFADEATVEERVQWVFTNRPELTPEIKRIQQYSDQDWGDDDYESYMSRYLNTQNIPVYRLSCQLYQRKQNCAFVA